MSKRTQWILLAALAVSAHVSGCGGKSPSGPSDPGPVVQTNTITISSTGASPRNVEVPLGGRVLFINNDSRAHDMSSDPHPEHTNCPEINLVGLLTPGQRRETGNFVQARSCGFHDHNDPANTALQGIITAK